MPAAMPACQRKQGLVIALEANQPDPDLFLMDIVWITQFVQSEWLRPLDLFFDRGPISPRDLFPRVVAAVDRHGGRIYALPAFLDVGLVFDRENLFVFDKTDGPTLT